MPKLSVFSHGVFRNGETKGSHRDASERGIWAIKWSFVILAIAAILQLIVVFTSVSVALLADTIHNVGNATTAIPFGSRSFWCAASRLRRSTLVLDVLRILRGC